MVKSELLSEQVLTIKSEEISLSSASEERKHNCACADYICSDQLVSCSYYDKSYSRPTLKNRGGSEGSVIETKREIKDETFSEESSLTPEVSNANSPSFDLHMSSESEENHGKYPIKRYIIPPLNSEPSSLEESTMSPNVSTSSERLDHRMKDFSPNVFGSPEDNLSQDLFSTSSSLVESTTSDSSAISSTDVSPGNNNRENVEEWSSQELSDISQNLKIRSKQAKRLVMAIIRKRQMEDESLDAFKKRLKKL